MNNKKLTNVLPYIGKPRSLEQFLVTSNFSINVDEELLSSMLPEGKSLEELDKLEVQESHPLVSSIDTFIGWISEYHNTIQWYFILESINYTIKEDDSLLITFIWEKVIKDIPRPVYDFITEHDETTVSLLPLVEDNKTLQISYSLV